MSRRRFHSQNRCVGCCATGPWEAGAAPCDKSGAVDRLVRPARAFLGRLPAIHQATEDSLEDLHSRQDPVG